MKKFLSEMTELDLIQQLAYPVRYRPESYPTYPGDPDGDDPNEFGAVYDFNRDYIMSGQNGLCKLVTTALNALAEKNGIEVRERPAPKKGKKKS